MGVRADDFDFVSKFVRREIGIVLEAGKEYLVETRLGPLATSEGFDSLGSLVAALKSVTATAELKKKVLDAMTTNETLFFRDAKPFDALKQSIIPQLIKQLSASRSLTLWSAAASSGQEAYSIAMLIKENFPELNSWKIRILGTDICSQVLEKAREGVYSQFEVNRGLPAPLLMKYFDRKGMRWAIKPELKDLVSFEHLNLLESWQAIPKADIIFMRNVLIYFDEATKRSLLSKVRSQLSAGGFFFVGGSETIGNLDGSFVREVHGEAQVYRVKHL